MLQRFWKYRLRDERESLKWLLSLDLNGKTVVDVGANRGIYSYWMSRAVGPDGRVVAFEPQPEMAVFIAEVKTAFGLGALNVVGKGLSASPGTATLRRAFVGSGGAFIGDSMESAEGMEELLVEVTTLDLALAGEQEVAVIKCDVEGHELEVFRGGEKILGTHGPALLFECHQPAAEKGDLFGHLVDRGYDGWFVERGVRHHFAEFATVPYRKPGLAHRNYVFERV